MIQKFLVEHSFPEGKDDDQWDWDDVLPIVGMDFIMQHLGDIPFDLTDITKELDDTRRQYIVTNPDARWDWQFVVTEYPIDFIVLTSLSCIRISICRYLCSAFLLIMNSPTFMRHRNAER